MDVAKEYWWIGVVGLVALAVKAGWLDRLLSDSNTVGQQSASSQPVSPKVEDALTNKNKPKKKPEPRSVDTSGMQHFRSGQSDSPPGGSPVQFAPTMNVVGVDPTQDETPAPGTARYKAMMRAKYEAERDQKYHENLG